VPSVYLQIPVLDTSTAAMVRGGLASISAREDTRLYTISDGWNHWLRRRSSQSRDRSRAILGDESLTAQTPIAQRARQ